MDLIKADVLCERRKKYQWDFCMDNVNHWNIAIILSLTRVCFCFLFSCQEENIHRSRPDEPENATFLNTTLQRLFLYYTLE